MTITMKDFRNTIIPNWCPGCGDFSVQAAIQRAAANLSIEPHNLAVISGIGCSGRISGYIRSYGLHGIHGRALPIAQGVKLANNDLTVIASGGDGDGFAIGMAHTVHAIRRNINMTYIVMDNQIYGLTKGQTSPRSQQGFVTKSTPEGAIEPEVSVMQLALSSGATFVAQAFSNDIKGLIAILEEAVRHEGFSFVNVFSPCVTYNKVNTFEGFKANLTKLDDIENYDRHNKIQAMTTLMQYNDLVTGIIYQENGPCYERNLPGYDVNQPLVHQDLSFDKTLFNNLEKQFM